MSRFKQVEPRGLESERELSDVRPETEALFGLALELEAKWSRVRSKTVTTKTEGEVARKGVVEVAARVEKLAESRARRIAAGLGFHPPD